MIDGIKFRTIYADPPWYEIGGGKICRGAQKHYPIMKTPEILSLMQRILEEKIDENAHIYLWVTNNHLFDGFKILEGLGFRYVTCITWLKNQIGLGQYFRGITEHCLFGVKGSLPYKLLDNGRRAQGRTGFFANKTIHSSKPDIMYEMIEKVSYPPYLEMFARERRIGWENWGNEISEV